MDIDDLEKFPRDRDGDRYDPKERDPQYRAIIKEADKEAEDILAKRFPGLKGQMGYCQSFWGAKKRILKEKHGIDWKTPDELNPEACFD